MHQTLVRDSQYDVDREQRHHHKYDLVDERLLEIPRSACETAAYRTRHREPLLQLLYSDGGLLERNSRRQIERNRHCGEESVVINRERRSRIRCLYESIKRNGISAGWVNINRIHSQRVLPILRRCFHDDVILVQRCVDGGDLRLPERSVERLVNELWGDAQSSSRATVIPDRGLQSAILLIDVDVLEFR